MVLKAPLKYIGKTQKAFSEIMTWELEITHRPCSQVLLGIASFFLCFFLSIFLNFLLKPSQKRKCESTHDDRRLTANHVN